jgi:hypothetical protein
MTGSRTPIACAIAAGLIGRARPELAAPTGITFTHVHIIDGTGCRCRSASSIAYEM